MTEKTAHEPTEETRAQVRELAKTKSEKRCARALGLGIAEFEFHYLDDFETGKAEAKEDLLQKLLDQGLAGNSNAAVKYMTIMDMVAPKRIEHTGKDGRPIEVVDLSKLTEEQLREYGRLSAIAQGLDPDTIEQLRV